MFISIDIMEAPRDIAINVAATMRDPSWPTYFAEKAAIAEASTPKNEAERHRLRLMSEQAQKPSSQTALHAEWAFCSGVRHVELDLALGDRTEASLNVKALLSISELQLGPPIEPTLRDISSEKLERFRMFQSWIPQLNGLSELLGGINSVNLWTDYYTIRMDLIMSGRTSELTRPYQYNGIQDCRIEDERVRVQQRLCSQSKVEELLFTDYAYWVGVWNGLEQNRDHRGISYQMFDQARSMAQGFGLLCDKFCRKKS